MPVIRLINQWYGVVTTAEVPRALADSPSAGVAAAIKSPDVAQRLAGDGSIAVGSTAAEFGALIQQEIVKWRQVLKDTGMVLN